MGSMMTPIGIAPSDLFDAIGTFLADHHLSPEPANYAFAYTVLSDPAGPLARAVAEITDGGIRLSREDIRNLGVGAGGDWAPWRAADAARAELADHVAAANQRADQLIARADLQVSGFSDLVRAMHAETTGFGRNLAESAAAIRRADPLAGGDELARLTGAMIERVRSSEQRLAAAEQEADELRRALDEARDCARLDPLTELTNRRGFDEAFGALSPDTPIAIALCDIDHFKRVNDEFGHAVGDRVLRAVGQTLAGAVEHGLVARYGGEEFAVLMSGPAVASARDALDRARGAVAARRFRVRDTDMPIGEVTISGGIAIGRAADALEALYAVADAALYEAKANGRNRVICAA